MPETAKCDVVRVARDRLLADPSRCKYTTARPTIGQAVKLRGRAGGGAEEQHQCGSVRCVTAYLGGGREGTYWNRSMVGDFLQIEDNLDDSLKTYIATTKGTGNHPERQGAVIKHSDAVVISSLPKKAQKAAAHVLRSASNNKIAIPAKVVRETVRRVQDEVKESEQASAVRDALEEQVETERRKRLPDGNSVAETIAHGLLDFPDDEKMQAVIEGRGLLKTYVKNGLIVALTKTIKRLQGYIDGLERPVLKSLPEATKREGDLLN